MLRDCPSRVRIDQRRMRVNAKLAKRSAEQKRFILAVAEPSTEDNAWLSRHMRILAKLDTGVAHFVLHKPQRLEQTLFGIVIVFAPAI